MSDYNVNMAQCLRESTDFGVNHIYNICNGTVHDVPWGAVDWFALCGLSLLGVGLLVLVCTPVVMMLRD